LDGKNLELAEGERISEVIRSHRSSYGFFGRSSCSSSGPSAVLVESDVNAEFRGWAKLYEFKFENTPKAERTNVLVGLMTTGRQEGRGKGSATSNIVEIQLKVWLENRSRSITMQVPDRITSASLLEQTWRELGTDQERGKSWQFWQGDQIAIPPLKNGQEYSFIPADLEVGEPGTQVTKREIDFMSEIRKHGPLVSVTVTINGISQNLRIPQEVAISQLIRRHVAISALPAKTTFIWGTITGRGKPGQPKDGDIVSIKTESAVISKCSFYKGEGEFTKAVEIDLNRVTEAELLAERDRRWPELAGEVLSGDGGAPDSTSSTRNFGLSEANRANDRRLTGINNGGSRTDAADRTPAQNQVGTSG
jgi:hypothetical protein